MVGHLLRYHPAFVSLRALVQDGGFGKLHSVYLHRILRGKMRLEENILRSFEPHDVSMLLSLFGAEPVAVSGAGGAFLNAGIEDEFCLDMVFPGGGCGHVFASCLHPFKEHWLVVAGEKGMAVFEDSTQGANKLLLYRHRIDMNRRPPEPVKAEAEPTALRCGRTAEKRVRPFPGMRPNRSDAPNRRRRGAGCPEDPYDRLIA